MVARSTGLLVVFLLLGPGQNRLPADQEISAAHIPLRPAKAPTGSEFILSVTGLAPRDREAEIYRQLVSGNLPDFLRRLKPVTLEAFLPGRGQTRAEVFVMPDYLAIGSDEDFVRIPMSYYTAAALCREWGFVLPTRKIVDATYRQAEARLAPKPMTPGPRMSSSSYYATHNRAIEEQLDGHGGAGRLVAGHKKDLVLTNRLWTRRARVAIYGWHLRRDRVIQPLSTVHGGTYADYSHGVRLVSERMIVGGQELSVVAALEDADLARLLTSEGRIQNVEGLLNLPPPQGWKPRAARSKT